MLRERTFISCPVVTITAVRMIKFNSEYISIESTTNFGKETAKYLSLFNGFAVYILTLRMTSNCFQEAQPFLHFYSVNMSSTIVFDSYFSWNNGKELNAKFNHSTRVVWSSKFVPKSVQLFLPAFTVTLNKTGLGLGFLRSVIYASKETHNFYVTFAPMWMRSLPYLRDWLKAFKDISVPAPFIFVWECQRMELLCVFCPHVKETAIHSFYDVSALQTHNEIEELHAKMSTDMLGTAVSMYGVDGRNDSCSRLRTGLLMQPNSCGAYEAFQSLNSTLDVHRALNITAAWDDGYVAHVIGGLFSGYAQALRERKIPFEWVNAGEQIHTFSFVNVVNTGASGISAIWRAFEVRIWVAFLVTGTAMAFLLSCAFKQHGTSWLSNVGCSVGVVLSLLIEQFSLPGSCVKRTTALLALATFAWAQLALVLNTSYKGYLFSTMASKSIPDVPKDMEGLAETSAFMFSTTSVGYYGKKVSFFHYQIGNVLKRRNTSTDGFARVIDKFSRRLLFTESDLLSVVLHQSLSRSNKTLVKAWNNATTELRIPSTQVYVATSQEVETYVMLMNLLNRNDRRAFVFGEGLPLFLNRSPFFVRPNFFLPTFTRKLMSIMQSGLWDMWDKAFRSAYVIIYAKVGAKEAAEAGVVARSLHRVILPPIFGDTRPPKPEEIVQALPVEFMLGPLQALGWGALVAFVVLLIEIVRRFSRKSTGRRSYRPVSNMQQLGTVHIEVR